MKNHYLPFQVIMGPNQLILHDPRLLSMQIWKAFYVKENTVSQNILIFFRLGKNLIKRIKNIISWNGIDPTLLLWRMSYICICICKYSLINNWIVKIMLPNISPKEKYTCNMFVLCMHWSSCRKFIFWDQLVKKN